MKLARIVCFAIAVTLIAGWASHSSACDKDKASASAAHASGVCTAEMAAKCTPEMAAACQAKMSAAAASQCPAMKASAVTASASGTSRLSGTTASVASSGGSCSMHGMKASAASAGATCNMSGMKASAASVSASGKDACCAGKASAASAGACATMKSASAGQCSGHGMGAMASSTMHDDCDACLDMANCNDALDAAGAHRQSVWLKNGVMYIYTADTQRNVSAVQVAVARRGERMARFASAGESARLCPECKSMRGAMASHKLTREVVNIEGGSLTLVTSSDPRMVEKLHAMAEPRVAARTKS